MCEIRMSLEQFDEIISRYEFLVNNLSCTEEFMRFVTIVEEDRIHYKEVVTERDGLKVQLRSTQDELTSFERKFETVRKMFDKEKFLRTKAEKDLEAKVTLINTVMAALGNEEDKISEETKSKLSDLKNSFRRTERPHVEVNGGRLSIVNEAESTNSIVSDLTYSMSEDFSDDNILRDREHSIIEHRPRKSGQRTSMRASDLCDRKQFQLRGGERITATSTLTYEDGKATASAQVDLASPPRKMKRRSEVIVPPLESVVPSAPARSASTSLEEFLPPPEDDFQDTQLSPNKPMTAKDNIHFRQHGTLSHKIILPVSCGVCKKKMTYYTTQTVKCQKCKVIVHAACEQYLPLPCVPVSAPTPGHSSKRPHHNVLASYAPSEAPMIPPLVIHCVYEIEKRGFTEEGLYRKSGCADQIKELKRELLAGDTKLLGTADIFTVCSTLKDFLRSLDEPLVPLTMWSWFTQASSSGNEDEDDARSRLIGAVANLPQPNKETLAYLILHLQRVAQLVETKMSHESLSIVFGPCIVGYSNKSIQNICTEVDIVNRTVLHLLNIDAHYWNSILSKSMANIEVTPTSYRSVQNTPSTDSLAQRALNRKMTTPSLTFSERKKKKYFKNVRPSQFKF